MSPLQVLQLVGYTVGSVLTFWMAGLLLSRRLKLTSLERVLLVLALSIGAWHASNLIVTLHGLFRLTYSNWTTLLRIADTVAVISITLAYSFLLHVHLHLWANANQRPLSRNEKLRVYLSYVPAFFLVVAVPRIWSGTYAPMFVKLSFFVLPFAFWIAYVLGLIAVTELLIARRSRNAGERKIMRTLAASFIAVGVVILAALALDVGEGTRVGLYLKTIANLGSLLPSALLVYYIYRYRYLELIIEESLVVATFAAVVLTVYLYGIRTIGDWVTSRYRVTPGVVEALLILVLVLVAAPLRGWLAARFHALFAKETALYREIVARIGSDTSQHKQLPELLHFVEEKTTQTLGLRRVKIVIADNGSNEMDESLMNEIFRLSEQKGWTAVEDHQQLVESGFNVAYPLRREDRVTGVLLVDGAESSLTPDARAVIEVLAGQVAIAIEDWRLVEENVRLERELAERERLAVLGQMAATVAHEIKNPLSAIKSIAQVMREDAKLSADYSRDLSLIVGETDRLNQSVMQLLSFARRPASAERPQHIAELVNSVTTLFQANATEQKISFVSRIQSDALVPGSAVPAVRDSLGNLVTNALQASSAGSHIYISAEVEAEILILTVQDSGTGVPDELRERIWEPFFTTKQRGTGLGLAIVRKRMQECGGTARLKSSNGRGATFELRLPLLPG